MVKITSSKADGEKFQIVVELDRASSGIGYSNMNDSPTLSFSLPASSERETGRFGRKAKLSGRNVQVRLESHDLIAVVNRLVNPNYSSGYHFNGEATSADDTLVNSVMQACGLWAVEYRYPADHYTCRNGWLHVWALNERHAIYQFSRFNFMKGPIDSEKLQHAEVDSEGQKSWLDVFNCQVIERELD